MKALFWLSQTGISANKWTEILRFDTIQSFGKEEAIVYVGQNLSFGDIEPEDTEALEVKKLHVDDAIAMALKGEIRDSISLAALLKLALDKRNFAP